MLVLDVSVVVDGGRRRPLSTSVVWYEHRVQQKNVEEPRALGLPAELLEILVCPKSKAKLVYVNDGGGDGGGEGGGEGAEGFLLCPTSRLKYRIEAGVPVMLVDEAVELSADAVDRLMASQRR